MRIRFSHILAGLVFIANEKTLHAATTSKGECKAYAVTCRGRLHRRGGPRSIRPSVLAAATTNGTSILLRDDAVLSAALLLRPHRGGACMDSNPSLFAKIALSAASEAAALMLVIKVGSAIGDSPLGTKNLPRIAGVALPLLLALLAVVFSSGLFADLVNVGISAASNQVLKPNQTPGDPKWYGSLKKPSWNPPGWLFPIMWLIVSKPTQLIALVRLLGSSNNDAAGNDAKLLLPWVELAVYCSYLALGDVWNQVFFGLQCTGRGAAVITAFYASLLLSTFLFGRVNPAAGKFMLPTCGWVTVATALNWNIYFNN